MAFINEVIVFISFFIDDPSKLHIAKPTVGTNTFGHLINFFHSFPYQFPHNRINFFFSLFVFFCLFCRISSQIIVRFCGSVSRIHFSDVSRVITNAYRRQLIAKGNKRTLIMVDHHNFYLLSYSTANLSLRGNHRKTIFFLPSPIRYKENSIIYLCQTKLQLNWFYSEFRCGYSRSN